MGKKSASRANERERFDLDGEESESVNNSTRPTKSKATIEEIHEGDEDYNNKPDRTNETKKNNQPKKPAPGVKLTPTQRKSMQKANKNPHNGGKSSVTVTDADDDEDELINEEDEGVEGLSSSDGDGGDDGSDSDVGSDGEADWERDDAPKIIAKKSPNHPSKPWTLSSILLWTSVFVLLCGLVWLRLQDASIWEGIDPDDIDMTTRPPSEQEDYYQILQVDRNADMKQIKASYRKLVLQTHPDKNPDSDSSKFQAVQKAYDVLSNPEKRAMYDSIETTYDVLQSETVELTTANFESEVLQTDAVWVIQVYTDWHKSAIRFSQAWEEAAQRYGKLVSFGRVHAHRQRELTKRLHTVKFGVIPTVVIYSNGQFSDAKTFLDSSHQALSKLSHFIADHFPNTVSSVGNSLKEMKSFMKSADSDQTTARVLFFPDFAKQAATQRKQHQQQRPQHGSQQQRFQQQMLANKNRINEPSLTYKAIARKFQYAVQFGQVEQIAEPAKWKSWIKEICTTYKLSAPSSLPALLYQESDDSSPKWLTGDLTKDKLLKHMDGVHKRMVPWMNSHSYARHCVEAASKSSTICVIGLACQPLKIGELEFNSFASGGRALQKQAAFRNVPLQFAKVDIARQSDMAPLCASLPADAQKSSELSIVVIMNHGTELYHFGQREHQHQQFDAWLNHVVKQDGKIKSLAAPFIPVVHIPDDVLPLTLPSVGQVFIPLRWIYGIGIIGALIILSPIISQYFAKFVYFIFALSIIVPGLELMKDVYEKYYLS